MEDVLVRLTSLVVLENENKEDLYDTYLVIGKRQIDPFCKKAYDYVGVPELEGYCIGKYGDNMRYFNHYEIKTVLY